MDEWDKVYQKWKSIEDEKAEKIKNKKEEKRKAEVRQGRRGERWGGEERRRGRDTKA